jgi:hypothetical protein
VPCVLEAMLVLLTLQYALFACGYLWFSDECVDGIERFSHAFFFSVQTSATIGAACAVPYVCTHASCTA